MKGKILMKGRSKSSRLRFNAERSGAKTLKRLLSVVLSLALVLTLIPMNSLTVKAASSTVSSLEELQSALADDSISTIIVSETITLPNGTSLNGNGKTVQVKEPYLTECGTISSSYSEYNVFRISAGSTVTIDNMTIYGSKCSDDSEFYSGNGCIVNCGTLYLKNSTISRAYRGLLTYGSDSKAILTNTNIVRNVCDAGGGIVCAYGMLIMDGCSLSENRSIANGCGGGAMEISAGGTLYANNTIIANNCSSEIGGAINNYASNIYIMNSTIVGNITTANASYGGGFGLNRGKLYAVNCILKDNQYIDNGTGTPVASDVGVFSGTGSKFINCIYGKIQNANAGITMTDCKEITDYSTFGSYRNDGVWYGAGDETTGYQHTVLVANSGNTNSLYANPSSTGPAKDGGIDTYFDYSDLSNIKMSYGPSGSMTALTTNSAAAENKVITYYEGGMRESGIIGACATTSQTTYTVKLVAAPSKGTVSGITLYGDGYISGTNVTIKAVADTGYDFVEWQKADGTSVSTSAEYTFSITENVSLKAIFVHSNNWEYSLEGKNKLTAHCKKAGHSCSDVTLTLSVTSQAYSGSAATINIGTPEEKAAWTSAGLTVPTTIDYEKSDGISLPSAPTTVGCYVAKVTVGDATAKVSYTIDKADPTLTVPTAVTDLTYDGTNKTLINAGSSSHGEFKYSLTQNGEYTTTLPVGKNAGDYSVYYKFFGDNEHSDKTYTIPINVSIAKANNTTVDKTATNDILAGFASSVSVTLPAIPENMSYGTPTSLYSELSGLSVSDGKLNYSGSAAIVNANAYTVIVPVVGGAGANYNNYNITVTLNGKSCEHTNKTVHEKVEPTCTETGTEKYWTCDVCSTKLNETGNKIADETTLVIAALGHDKGTHHDAVAATCSTTGNVEYWDCSRTGCTAKIDDSKQEIANVTVAINSSNHNWGYTASGATLTATCAHNASHTASLTLSATSQAYSGSEVSASYNTGEAEAWKATTGSDAPEILYYLSDGITPTDAANSGARGTNKAPKNVGSYVAKATVGTNKTAKKTFSIVKATSPIDTKPASPSSDDLSTPTSKPTEKYTIPVKNVNTVPVTAGITDGVAKVGEIDDKVIEQVTGDYKPDAAGNISDTITIDLSGAKQKVTGITISKKSIEEFAKATEDKNNKIDTVTIELSKATVVLDAKTLETLAEDAKGTNIKLVVDDKEQNKLNESQKTSIKDYHVATSFEAYFESDGTRIHDFKGGKATVSIEFKPEAGKSIEHYHMIYLPNEGGMTRFQTKYQNGKLIFTTTHFSDYAVIYDVNEKNETGKENEKLVDEKAVDDKSIKKQVAENTIEINKGLKVSQNGNNLSVVWGKVDDADGYLVYATYCGTDFGRAVKTVKDPDVTAVTITKLGGKQLNLKKNYKVCIKAYKLVDGKKVILGRTIIAHVVGKNNTKYTNVMSIKLISKSNVVLQVGKTSKIVAKTILVNPAKQQLSDDHAKEFRYVSSDKTVATVSQNGKITAKGTGTCTVYVYARNGYTKAVKVTVK